MQSKLLEGRPLADKIKKDLAVNIEEIKKEKKFLPILASIQVGDNQGASIYVNAQKKFAQSLGIQYQLCHLSQNTPKDKLIGLIEELNHDKKITGIIIIAPLPEELNHQELVYKILPSKDVEGLHPENLGFLILGKPRFSPCTPQAVIELLKSTNVKLYGKEAVIVGSSDIVGKPLSQLLLKEFMTTTVCHIATYEANKLISHINQAEVLISAVGKPSLIKANWIKDGAIVIDVGISKISDKITGDVEFSEASKRASFITPVPGGVGPLTTAMLFKNVVRAYSLQ